MPLVLAILFINACAGLQRDEDKSAWSANISSFEQEIRDLQSALAIPGLAYLIVKEGETIASNGLGYAQEDPATAFTTATPLRIASVTKTLTAVAVMQLVEEGRLDLDAPVHRYVSAPTLSDNVLVRHLLTHTSEGKPGEEYVYGTTRYAILGPIIEAVTGSSFGEVLRERILARSGMPTYASPALGAHAGLVSTAGDMGAYLAAIGAGKLLKPSSLKQLARPSLSTTGSQLPVSLGWFAQTVQGQHVMWSFGQDDPEHSGALLIHMPERNLSLFILANANVLSDPFRLLMGDVTKSPFAMSFLRLFAFSRPGAPLARPERGAADLAQALAVFEERNTYKYREELIGWALIDLWVGQTEEAQRKFDLAFSRYGAEPDAAVLFAALRFEDEHFKDLAIRMGEQLLSALPNNRWLLLFQGYLLQQRERFEEGSICFHRILALPNQEPDFLDRLFKGWSWTALARINIESNPVQARVYAQKVVDSGIGGSLLEEAMRLLTRLN